MMAAPNPSSELLPRVTPLAARVSDDGRRPESSVWHGRKNAAGGSRSRVSLFDYQGYRQGAVHRYPTWAPATTQALQQAPLHHAKSGVRPAAACSPLVSEAPSGGKPPPLKRHGSSRLNRFHIGVRGGSFH